MRQTRKQLRIYLYYNENIYARIILDGSPPLMMHAPSGADNAPLPGYFRQH
jgi:hypothetical protein